MLQKVLDILEKEYPDYAFGRNKEGHLFVNGQNTNIKITLESDAILSSTYADLQGTVVQSVFEYLKEELAKAKIISPFRNGIFCNNK